MFGNVLQIRKDFFKRLTARQKNDDGFARVLFSRSKRERERREQDELRSLVFLLVILAYKPP